MHAHIGHHHTHYRLIDTKHTETGIVDRLDRLAQSDLARCWGAAMDLALADDPAVYVVRRVNARVVLRLNRGETDEMLMRRWGESLAAATMRGIAASGPLGADLIRFENQAEYVARFVTDLLCDRAWDCWYYGAFAALRRLDGKTALFQVLTDNRDHLPAILGLLQRSEALDRLFQALNPRSVARLWEQGLSSGAPPGREANRPPFAAALRIVEGLDWWRGTPPNPRVLFQQWPGPETLVDWRDPTALASAVLEILVFLHMRGYLRPGAPSATLDSAISRVLASLDWLDTPYLEQKIRRLALVWAQAADDREQAAPTTQSLPLPAAAKGPDQDGDLDSPTTAHGDSDFAAISRDPARRLAGEARSLRPSPSAKETPPFPDQPELPELQDYNGEPRPVAGVGTRPALEPTPRQRRLLTELSSLPASVLSALDPKDPDSRANALRVYAWLAARDADWQGDPLVPAVIDRLLAAWAGCQQAGVHKSLPEQPQRMDPTTLLQRATPQARDSLHAALTRLQPFGEPGLKVLQRWSQALPAEPLRAARWHDTACAGVFRLLRAILDARLGALVRNTGVPPEGALPPQSLLLLTLGLRWAGAAGLRQGGIDLGLALFAELESAPAPALLAAQWTAPRATDHLRFQAELLHTLVAQRLLGDSVLHLYQPQDDVLIAGTGRSDPWPLGAMLSSGAAATDPVTAWCEAWQTATGAAPELVIADRSLKDAGLLLPAAADGRIIWVAEQGPSSDPGGDAAAEHRAGRAALAAALQALDAGRLGVPAADLTLALTAAALLRIWARWLGRFADSTLPYLLDNFIRQPGRVRLEPKVITVEIAPGPLDVVLELAGYQAPLEPVPGLIERRVVYATGGAR